MEPKKFDGRGEGWEDWVEKFLEYGWIREQLPAGDFQFVSSDKRLVGLESKSTNDLLSRLEDARRELAHMIDMVDIPIIIVFGPWNRLSTSDVLMVGKNNHITWKQVWNMLETFQDSGLRVQIATNRSHAFQRINQLFAYYQKPEHSSILARRKASVDRRVAALMAIPGVSKKLGGTLLKSFSSIKDLANAEPAKLANVPLFGLSRAKVVWDFFNRKDPL